VFALHIDTARTWRGGQQQVLLTVLGLRARGHRAVLVAHPEGELYRRASEGTDLLPLAPRNEIDLATAWKLSKIVRQWKPAIVHAHDPHAVTMAALALSFGAPEPRPRIVASRRVDFHLQSHAFSQWKYRQVDGFIAASNAIKQVLVEDRIPAGRIAVVHDGIDVEKIQNRPAIDLHAEYWLPHGVPVIVNVGALVGHKGQRYLIDAMPQVLREVPDAHLVIFGEGELRPALERQVRHLSLGKRVLLPGFREDVLSLMKSADLFVMSSVTEGLGSAVLDAMAMGLAVVGTRAGGIPEAVVPDETGILVDPGEPAPLAAAIVTLLKDPALRRAHGAAGQARVATRFGVDRLVEGTLQCYERFVAASQFANSV
jgi:glycosyltransferase involved in cell wall biosynthesis